MKRIETTIEVDDQRKATTQFPVDLASGPHRVVMVIDEPIAACRPLTFSAHDVVPWPEGFTVRREEVYGGDDR